MVQFEWDEQKNQENIRRHYISFKEAQNAFKDPHRVIALDKKHSTKTEKRYFCYGQIQGQVCTIRFTYRNKNIRIIGAGYWRKERKIYEKEKART